LYVSYACPWANRCLAVRALKGLESVVDVAVVSPVWDFTKPGVDEHRGWVFDPSFKDSTPDPLFGARTLRDVYEKLSGDMTVKKFTVPLLVDRKQGRIVNNESSEIIRMFNTEFNSLSSKPELDLYPEALREEIDKINAHIYDTVNNGVYKCGFATKQEPYDIAFRSLFDALEHYDEVLGSRRFLLGDKLTEADIRFVMTLVRFDEVYVVHFKCNKKPIRYFKNLFDYTCDVYQQGIGPTINIAHIKNHYYGSHVKLNPYGIVPLGSADYTDFGRAHGRDSKF
jgi:putative glutathione S-transferase